ncbi:hypothetical protein FFWV33_15175 [Flavobacterium faecale]|uniref:Uncharacterized protein n=1 Tax=Flavobacterium faecale TaxID=1355330 RepID=A0A2S1LG98_9FLAO|nr:hypothetical protein [Flavobacterium faecale]AWG22773.1 hypothetical protein FFWV33_15175 [Flavobacterium faecale]
MDTIINYLIEEKEWIFSGIGVFILGFFFYRKTANTSVNQKQKISDNSTGIQANGDVNINTKKD